MSKENTAEQQNAPAAQQNAPETTEEQQAIATRYYQMQEHGQCTGAVSGKPYRYAPGDVIEAPEGEFVHLGIEGSEERPGPTPADED